MTEYTAAVWDCPCGIKKIAATCPDCPGCLAERDTPIYLGRCWGYRIETNPVIALKDVKRRRFDLLPRAVPVDDDTRE